MLDAGIKDPFRVEDRPVAFNVLKYKNFNDMISDSILQRIFFFLAATPVAYGSSQGNGQIQVAAAGHVRDLQHRSWQRQILNLLSKPRDRTHILMDTSWTHFHWATKGIPKQLLRIYHLSILI